MKYLADTNIYLRLINTNDPQSGLVSKAISTLIGDQHHLLIAPQSIYELWSVATRPVQANGLGWLPTQTRNIIDWLTLEFELLSDSNDLYSHWLELVTKHQVSGKPSHDARLVAAMQLHGLTNLLTLNTEDFKRFAGVNLFHPKDF
jgi:predicted nucleic acid-binding protein